jgi:hypothetical protein
MLRVLLAAAVVIALAAFASTKLVGSSKPASPSKLGVLNIPTTGASTHGGVADSLAPPGAPRKWLPNFDWVLEHWMPYDQQQLFSILGVTLEQTRQYLASGPKTEPVPPLAGLIRSKGFNVDQLAKRLVSAWHPPSALYPELVSRALETFTQGHLLQHMLFHTFHDKALNRATPQIFGVSPEELHQDLLRGIDRLRIGEQHGRTYQQMVAATAAVLRAEEALGVREHVTPASEASEELAYQTARISMWLKFAGPDPQQDIVGPPTAGG